ncbi:MAG: hypothetical protein E5Y89_02190 [Mesorhizobium sp.]|uniref:hypothetical protein n=1 Tax=Mesorhizobium sp. TaxID=1871066 RepID=UPI000FE794CE|nr:hypothetical protein [Mesorhizobium sp.]RWD30846.1 MAG: hypothetical protein EOS22_06245 [Mesorhizobium sp.]TIL83103.1 MAG: hypothetical protein E5Y89_02190 [Mesorhizobium sp.]TJW66519.1 MAG: hypothetical protein E5V29_21900 [Mesorhizobium sp.]
MIAIGYYLDDHSKTTPVSVSGAIFAIRKKAITTLSDEELEELIVESAGARHLAVLLDTHDD